MSKVAMGFRQIHLDFHTSPLIGDVGVKFDARKFAALAKEAYKTGKTIRQLCIEKQILPEAQLNEALDPWRMTKPS